MAEKTHEDWRGFFPRYWGLVKEHRKRVFLEILLVLAVQALALVEPLMVMSIVDEVVKNQARALGKLLFLALLGLAGLFAIALLKKTQVSYARSITCDIERDLPVRCLQKILALPLSVHQRLGTGVLVGKIQRGINKVVELTWDVFFEFIPIFILALATLIVLLIIEPVVAILVVGGSVVFGYILIRVRRRFWPEEKKRFDRQEEADHCFSEAVTNFLTVQACTQQQNEVEQLSTLTTKVHKMIEEQFAAYNKNGLQRNLLMSFVRTAAICFTAYMAIKGKYPIGRMVFVAMLVDRFVNNLFHLGWVCDKFQNSIEPVWRIADLLAMPVSICDPEQPKTWNNPVKGTIEFRDVSLVYPAVSSFEGDGGLSEVGGDLGREAGQSESGESANIPVHRERTISGEHLANGDRAALNQVNLTIPAKTIVGLAGSSGCGKSTFAKAIPRFIDVTAGAICVDGIDVRELSLEELRQTIGYAGQDPDVFAKTIAENIAYPRRDATREEIIEAAKLAGAHGFIMEFPQGYNTLVGHRGLTLSGGQRQRIALARAVLNRAPILIFDEVTSAIDPVSIDRILKTLENLRGTCTVIIISHQLSTLQRLADWIMVMEDGKIAECGTHQELMTQGGLYHRLVMMQQRIEATL